VAFITTLQNEITIDEGEMSPVTLDCDNKSSDVVTHTDFPYDDWKIQWLWMNRKIFKQSELTIRQWFASIIHSNSDFHFTNRKKNRSKFTQVLLIWLLPATWRVKFDLDAHLPKLHSKTRLIQGRTVIDRNKNALETTKSKVDTRNSSKIEKRSSAKARSRYGEKQEQSKYTKHYFCDHEHDSTHSTTDWTLKNYAKSMRQESKYKRTFSKKDLRNELSFLSKQSSKKFMDI
jgi:hypothetical protein